MNEQQTEQARDTGQLREALERMVHAFACRAVKHRDGFAHPCQVSEAQAEYIRDIALGAAHEERGLDALLKTQPKNGKRIYNEEDTYVDGWFDAMRFIEGRLATPEAAP